MSEVAEYISKYFLTEDGIFWDVQYDEDEVIYTLRDGKTIAYKKELIDIMEKLTPQGLPPFGSLLFAIIGLRYSDPSLATKVCQSGERLKKMDSEGQTIGLEEFLKKLQDIPEEFRNGDNRITLLQFLFANCHNRLSEKKSLNAINYFKSREFWHENSHSHLFSISGKNVQVINLLEEKYPDAKSIIDGMLAVVPLEEEIEIITEEPVIQPSTIEPEDYIEKLRLNYDTFHVGALVKRIWSGLNIPMHSYIPSEQPLGGVSDISNKGEFDKLLISEFAYDDITLLSRLANNESLYIQKEVPPSASSNERFVLIDVSLKNWGNPHTMAFSILLALAKHPKTDIHTRSFVIGETLQEVNYDTEIDLVNALKVVDACLHPAGGMEKFFQKFSDYKNMEVILITEKSTLKYPQFSEVIANNREMLKYIVTTTSDGGIDVYKNLRSSKKFTQHLELPLAELWKDKPQINVELQVGRDEKKITDYPILFKNLEGYCQKFIGDYDNLYYITNKGSLFQSYHSGKRALEFTYKGLIHIMDNIRSVNCEFAKMGDYLLRFDKDSHKITVTNLTDDSKVVVDFPHYSYDHNGSFQTFFNHDGHFMYQSGPEYWKISPDGEITKTVEDHFLMDYKSVFRSRLNMSENQEIHYVGSWYGGNMLRNLKRVYINTDGEIVFNNHTLHCSSEGGYLYLHPAVNKDIMIRASRYDDNYYRFPNGSSVDLNKNGMFTLSSSGEEKSSIYIPSITDVPIAAATHELFAGQDYFQMTHKVEFRIKTVPRSHKKRVLEILEKYFNNPSFTPNAEFIFIDKLDESLANMLKHRLNLESIETEVFPMEMGKQKTIEVLKFMEDVIEPFINDIINHGTAA